jgi:hypothetical protein
MTRRLIHTMIIMIIGGIAQFACTENIPDCPTKMCILANENGWKLIEVYEDGIKQTADLSQYKIVLAMPDATAAQGTFNRTGTLGNTDSGVWKTENDNKILSLIPDNDLVRKEPYIIDTFSPRQLILIINRESNKVGPKQLKYVFEPL